MVGATVNLYTSDGVLIGSTVTDSNGFYQFTNLPVGDYYVQFVPPSGYLFSPQDPGSDGTGSSANASGFSIKVSIPLSPTGAVLNAGIFQDPSAIVLSHFEVRTSSAGVRVVWGTALELHTFGFRIYRSTNNRFDDAQLLTQQPILARGRAVSGAEYSWLDETAQPDVQYTYWLEEIETNGQTTVYGSAQLMPENSGDRRVFLPLLLR